MSNTTTTWEPGDRSPYGLPSKGNFDEAWAKAIKVPCAQCGATSKKLTVTKNRITILCSGFGDTGCYETIK